MFDDHEKKDICVLSSTNKYHVVQKGRHPFIMEFPIHVVEYTPGVTGLSLYKVELSDSIGFTRITGLTSSGMHRLFREADSSILLCILVLSIRSGRA